MMDTTKEYIEMCRELPDEIIKEREWEFYDTVYLEDLKSTRTVTLKYHFSHIVPDYDSVWLPRQDQLQEMIDDIFSNREIVPLTAKLHDVCIHLIQKHNFNGRTMEQLWLAFVMHEQYGKTWNGKVWI